MAALTTKTLLVCRLQSQAVPVLGAAAVVTTRHSSNLASYKRGRGGRSSFSGNVVTVLGASGFMGRYVVNKLGKTGSQVICPYRGEPYYMKELKLAGDLGQILFLPFHLKDEESLRTVMKYSNIVVNLIGRDFETRNFKFHDVHVEGARTIARVARECGVERLIHFSHLNASPNPTPIYSKKGSEYLKSKYEGEVAVREEFPDATIMRPADIFGAEDRFIAYYANKWRRQMMLVPLYKRGTATVKMPVFCSDVAQGVLNAINNPDTAGRSYDCVGPKSYLLSELVDYFQRCMKRVHPLPFITKNRTYMNPLFQLKVRVLSEVSQTLSMDKLDREHVSDTLTGNPTLEDLNITPTQIEERALFQLKKYRQRGDEDQMGQILKPAPPLVVATL